MNDKTTTTVTQVQWPVKKAKNNSMQILGAVLALLLVAGVAVGAYFVSTRVSSRQAVAPTAPESQPQAAETAGDGTDQCPVGSRDASLSRDIKFSVAGTILLFTKGNAGGTVQLVRKSPATPSKSITYTISSAAASQNTKTLTVAAGEIYTVKVIWSPSLLGIGWIRPKHPTTTTWVCGPTKSATCGANAAITDLVSMATSRAKLTGITTLSGTTNVLANIQCWGDPKENDPTQDYDFNDATIILGYKKAVTAGYCVNVKVFKKANNVYPTTPMTASQGIKPGDNLRLEVTGNIASLPNRFKVTIDGVNERTGDAASPVWRKFTGVKTGTNGKTYFYNDYLVKKGGAYKFIAQVGTKAVATSTTTPEVDPLVEADADFNANPDIGPDINYLGPPDQEIDTLAPETDVVAE